MIIKSVWNKKLLPDLIPAKITISGSFFISNRPRICQVFGWKPNAISIMLFASLKPGKSIFFLLLGVASSHFKVDVLSSSKAQEKSLSKPGVKVNFMSNSSSITLLLSNWSKRSFFPSNIIGEESETHFMLLSIYILVYDMRLMIPCIRSILRSK